jgi:iron complex transport system ATP-binding protein
MQEFAIEVNNFSYSFGNGDVLNSASFNVRKGEYITIVGPNGAGKTTLLKNIIRILKGGKGTIKVKGIDIKGFNQRELAKEITYVPQPDGRRYPFRVDEFILMSKYPYLNPFSKITAQDESEVDDVLESVHMSRFKSRDMNTLSSGERQKIMISASLVQKAEIFLLDEPTTFLDPRHEEEINRILKKLNRERNITIVSVTHNINLAAILSDKILALKDGRVAYFGDSERFMEKGVLSSIYDKKFELMTHPEKDIKIILPEVIC